MLMRLVTSMVLVGLAKTTSAATYSLTSNLIGQGFLNAFSWQAVADPTNGRVNYVTESTAQADGLVSVSGNQVTLRADSITVLSSSDPGRNSFRLQSNAQYTTHVAVFDIAHMPQGCGTWPAGEVDIVEGVNNQSPNLSSLHTSAIYETGNSGCGVQTNDINSFGLNFNGIGGGWYAIERASTFIRIYFWERGSSSVPDDVQYPGTSVNTDSWGTPAAYFPDTDCDFSTHFGPHNIIINLTFCGDWAGNSAVYSNSGCPSDCVDYVNQNPSAFVDAYFTFNSLNIYQ
ncbi:glycoside hydrolase family 16 protein [Pisolithus orientalis]|uniref:glycoside hydrolase family 16 protein n=1 Tax=Pisolithus orientalis TaxID=936130 RepID=UPI002224BEE9|nr:glycoside hydrolase family 16 protein [Pisolithus orientalis]KAI6032879.1 glycoside hydrolase family 16 protein [Pisolithus orientalis]